MPIFDEYDFSEEFTTSAGVSCPMDEDENEEDIKKLEDDIKNKYGNKLNVVSVDVSYDRHLIKEYKINEYPTWILFDKGEELMRESGCKSFNDLVEMIDRIM